MALQMAVHGSFFPHCIEPGLENALGNDREILFINEKVLKVLSCFLHFKEQLSASIFFDNIFGTSGGVHLEKNNLFQIIIQKQIFYQVPMPMMCINAYIFPEVSQSLLRLRI
jgi:hypothetical protein